MVELLHTVRDLLPLQAGGRRVAAARKRLGACYLPRGSATHAGLKNSPVAGMMKLGREGNFGGGGGLPHPYCNLRNSAFQGNPPGNCSFRGASWQFRGGMPLGSKKNPRWRGPIEVIVCAGMRSAFDWKGISSRCLPNLIRGVGFPKRSFGLALQGKASGNCSFDEQVPVLWLN